MAPLPAVEPLTRFVFDKDYYRPSDNSVKHPAFMPNKNMRTSVFCIRELEDTQIWGLANEHVIPILQKPLIGRADIKVSDATDIGLDVVPSDNPARHANITGWPGERSKRKLLALKLAAKAALHLVAA